MELRDRAQQVGPCVLVGQDIAEMDVVRDELRERLVGQHIDGPIQLDPQPSPIELPGLGADLVSVDLDVSLHRSNLAFAVASSNASGRQPSSHVARPSGSSS